MCSNLAPQHLCLSAIVQVTQLLNHSDDSSSCGNDSSLSQAAGSDEEAEEGESGEGLRMSALQQTMMEKPLPLVLPDSMCVLSCCFFVVKSPGHVV